MVDRDERSADVLKLSSRHPTRFFKGSHERVMIDFIDEPAVRRGRWLRFGGLQTLGSFGVSGIPETSSEGDFSVQMTRWLTPSGKICWTGLQPAQTLDIR